MISTHPISVLVHTFNEYRHLWPGFLERTDQWCMNWPTRFYFGTDIDDGWRAPAKWKTIHSGPGAWSNRLAALLAQIDTEYIFYMQEDHWPFKLTGYRPSYSYKRPPWPQYLFDLMKENDLWRLQISPINRYYQVYHNGLFFGSNDIYFFHQKSKYLVSHQPSVWKKSFLLECLAPGETPWKNEYEGTLRLNKRDDIKDRIAIYDCNWFDHVCVRGRFNDPPERFVET